jgi:hypothetical protein
MKEWVYFQHNGMSYRSNGVKLYFHDGWMPSTLAFEDVREAYEKAWDAQAKSTQSVDRISEERDLLRKALEGAVWSLEKLLEGSSEETVCGWVACVADLKQAREVLALTKSERGEKE